MLESGSCCLSPYILAAAMPHRELGSVYTPQAIAGKMVRACLDRWFDENHAATDRAAPPACRVLDPACGDGAFLLEVFDELCRRCLADDSAARLEIVRSSIFGVDIDPSAVAALRLKLLDRIRAPDERQAEVAAVIETNIRCGNSLTGPDFGNSWRERNPAAAEQRGCCVEAIDWLRQFTAAAVAGGFDVIIGNPPYLRERDAKGLFDRLTATDLGRRWRDARMDLWYYFVHRSLDLLSPAGILSFIVNSYWMSSRGAARLIERLAHETQFDEITLLDDVPVFPKIAGRHMIFRLSKGRRNAMPRVLIRRHGSDPATLEEYSLSHDELFEHGRIVVARPDPRQRIFAGRRALGDFFATRQGMAENPPAINGRLLRQFAGRYSLKEGVFVLRRAEVDRLNLSSDERALLRPYYDTSDVERYRLGPEPTHHVLYLTRTTAPTLDGLPQIAAHLERFRPILERRREARAGKIAWWHLHWPRAEEIFIRPRILAVQMGKRPQFVFAARPTFVGFSINLILAKHEDGFALPVLAGILNSELARTWFERHAKRRGVHLEINAHVLRQFPLPGRDEAFERKIEVLVTRRQEDAIDEAKARGLDDEINRCVIALYERAARRLDSPTSSFERTSSIPSPL